MNSLFRPNRLSALLLYILPTSYALASGYHFGTQSVNVQATANAASVEAASPTTLFYNPAGLTKLPGTQITANIITAVPRVKFIHAKGEYFNPRLDAPGATINGQKSGNIARKVIVVPHLYASHQISPQLTAGLGIYVPFGANTHYSHDSIMRYSVKKTDLTTLNIQPTIAYDFQNGHSIGFGVIAQYINAGLSKTVDFAPSLQKAKLPVRSGETDVNVNVKGRDWGLGYNLGWLWDINDQARVGLNYRSKVTHHLHGTAEWIPDGISFQKMGLIPVPASSTPLPLGKVATGAVRQAGYLAHEGASVKLVTPESLSLQGLYKVNPQLEVFGDITWTRHSRLNNLNIQYEHSKTVPDATGAKPVTRADSTIFKPHWRNTYRFSLGAAYQLDDHWQLRGGIGYDQSPVRNAKERLPTMPDNDRLLLAIGTKYAFDSHQTVDLAYTYLHIKNTSVNSYGYCGGDAKVGPSAVNCVSDRTHASADYRSSGHFFGMQYIYRF